MSKRRTEGARLLGQVSARQCEIAAALSCTQSAVAQWVAGTKTPRPQYRERFFALYGIPIDAWTREVGAPRAEQAPAAPSAPAAAPLDPRTPEIERRLRELLTQLDHMADSELSDQARLRKAITKANILKQLGSVTGEASEITEARIVRLPAFRRIVDALVRALDAWPDAQAACASALEQLSEGR